jgi:hypothetical protein
MNIVALVLAILAVVCGLLAFGHYFYIVEHKAKRAKTYARKFVYVEDDGSARVLAPDEEEYLNTEFHPNDGARPYIKSSYEALTPDGLIGGFLQKSKLPRNTHLGGGNNAQPDATRRAT